MREDLGLYRGKRKYDEKWVKGYYFEREEKPFIITDSYPTDEDYNRTPMRIIAVEVMPETVGRCSEVPDKNGVKIFEGDIVTTDLARPYLIVVFRDGCFMFNCNDGDGDYYDIMFPISNKPHTKYKYGEVIGNIFDTPGLLEKRDQ